MEALLTLCHVKSFLIFVVCVCVFVATVAVPFQVTVAKVNTEDRVLRFKCHATEDGDITINRVGIEHDVDTSGIAEMLEGVDTDDEKANAQDGHGIHEEGSTSDNEDYQEHVVGGDYVGPVFTDLDENLQYQFSCYLEVCLMHHLDVFP